MRRAQGYSHGLYPNLNNRSDSAEGAVLYFNFGLVPKPLYLDLVQTLEHLVGQSSIFSFYNATCVLGPECHPASITVSWPRLRLVPALLPDPSPV